MFPKALKYLFPSSLPIQIQHYGGWTLMNGSPRDGLILFHNLYLMRISLEYILICKANMQQWLTPIFKLSTEHLTLG